MAQRFEQFGKYLLLEKLATGGMAEVFLARATGHGGISKFVAIKRILPQYAESPEFIDMFKDEAKIAVNLNHSNIVSIYDFGVQTNQFYLVMDYVEGRNLRQILNKVKKSNLRLSIDQVIYAVKEVASGLDHAHRCLDGSTGKPLNITHRDMSPQNVMISFEGEVKIVDFGIAKAESQMETTRAGTLKGKFGYMSPEQAEGQTVDLRTDIFSLGIVLWELLANDRLFVASNELNTLRKIRDCQIPSLRKLNPNIPVELERITMKALARDRNLRYQTAAAMHRDLNRFLNRHYPEFSPQDFASFIKNQFAEEIFSTRQRQVEYAKVPGQEEATQAITATSLRPLSTVNNVLPSPNPVLDKSFTDNRTIDSDFASYAQDDDESQGHTPTNTGPVPNPSRHNIVSPQSSQYGLGNNEATMVAPPPAASQPATGQKNSELQLDERALGREMRRTARAGSNPSIYGYQTEESSQPSIRTNASINITGTQTRIRKRRRQKMIFNSQGFTLAMSFVFVVSAYTYMAKYHTGIVMPLIGALEPYLRPFHSLVGINEGHTHEGSSSPPKAEVIAPLPPTAVEEIIPVQPKAEKPKEAPKAATEPGASAAANMDADPAPLDPKEPTDSILVTSSPSGAEILVNGRPSGSLTPSRVDVPSNRDFSITLRRMGYVDYRRTGLRRENVGNRVSGTLQQALVGYLDIDVIPPQNAKVYVNGKLLKDEHLPISGYAVPAETAVMIKAEDTLTQQTAQQLIKVPKDRRIPVLLDLRRGQKSDRQPSRSR